MFAPSEEKDRTYLSTDPEGKEDLRRTVCEQESRKNSETRREVFTLERVT